MPRPFCCAHRTIDVTGVNLHDLAAFGGCQRFVVGFLLRVKDIGNVLRRLDILTERNRLVHEAGIGLADKFLVEKRPLGKRIDATDQLGNVIGTHFSFFRSNRLLERGGYLLVRDRQHQHLVIGQKTLLNGLAETDAINLLAVNGHVIHRAKIGVRFLRLVLHLVLVQTRRCRHVDALFAKDVFVVVNENKGGI